ncbi:uncharacterized protein LOC122041295 isoform X1 [Zingiber officinale]|uniref:uncharacterized protein LOC122041295 isoform X1 n=1 Tax=Zingiber officinale TaxID=94328 RepID=UPI001C4CDCC1|nr:uncharacterized protein LOC122041295 isoform X1 [Zingiber officinale]
MSMPASHLAARTSRSSRAGNAVTTTSSSHTKPFCQGMAEAHKQQNLNFGWLERGRKFLPIYQARRIKHNILLASTDDSITVNGTPHAPFGTEVEEMRLKLDEYFQGDSIGSGLVQSIHDAARAIELAIQRQTSSSRNSWFSKAWLGVDKNAWIKRLSYQAAVYSLLQAVLEISSRGDGRDRDVHISVQRSLLRLCAPLESTIQEELSIKNPIMYEWFMNDHHPVIVATLVNLFESDVLFSSATKLYSENESSDSATASDLSLLMLALSCLAAVRKLGSAKVSCSQFSSMLPDITGRFMDLLLDFLPIKRAYKSMKEIDLRREFLFHFGPRVAIGEFDNEHRAEEMAFWIDLVQTQLQQAIDREKIWSRLTTCESIEVLEKDLAIFGFFIALGRSTQSFLSSNGVEVSEEQIESIIRYLIGGSVLYYPQLSSISSYQLYVEVVCEELDWLPFYHGTISNVTSDNKDNQEDDSKTESISQVLKVCSYWVTSFIKYSKWLENPSHIKAARFLSGGHGMLKECMIQLGILMNSREDVREVQHGLETKISDQLELESFDETLENVEETLKRLEDLLQELHLSKLSRGKEHLRAACSDLERIRKLKKEAEFLEASFRAKAASLEQSDDCSLASTSRLGRISDNSSENTIIRKPDDVKPHGFWRILIPISNKRNKQELVEADLSVSSVNIDNLDEESNEIRRFKLLRDELIELERRVQRSTDETKNEQPDITDKKGKQASPNKHQTLVPAPEKENIVAKSLTKIKETTTDVWQGTQLLAIDVSAAVALLKRGASGDELTEKEKKALRRTLTDLASVIPIGFLMLLPVTAVGHAAMLAFIQRYVPALIPSTYAPERLDLLRQLEKVKQMEIVETSCDKDTETVSLGSSGSE